MSSKVATDGTIICRSTVMPGKADSVLDYFKSFLVTKKRKPKKKGQDAGVMPTIAKSDCVIALGLIRMKLDDFDAKIDPNNPGRFRGITDLMKDMRDVLGDMPILHIPTWGASHVRGAFRSDEKRGNKRHLIALVDLLNDYGGTEAKLKGAYEACIRAHHEFWESFSIGVEFQRTDPVQAKVLQLLSIPSLGRVQQGIVFSALRRRYKETRQVTTKKTWAGDKQSSMHKLQRGDVQVWDGQRLLVAVEVKDAVVDRVVWDRVEPTHGVHDYSLFILAVAYSPTSFQQNISSKAQTFAVHIADFVLTTMAFTAIEEAVSLDSVLADVLDIYNSEFCEQIEKDASLQITVTEA